MNIAKLCFIATGAVAANSVSLAQEPAEDVIPLPRLVQLCESCHGSKGVSERPDVPSLAGQSLDSILDALNAFYFQRRHCPQTTPGSADGEGGSTFDMCSIAGSLSQAEKMALAEHFAATSTSGD